MEERPQIQVSAAEGGLTTCAYCHDALSGAGGVACSGCGTELHRACWHELRSCPIAGCASRGPSPEEWARGRPRPSSGSSSASRITISPVKGGPRASCAYCHDQLPETGGMACSGCGTELHAACWHEVYSCPVTGCDASGPSPEEWASDVRPLSPDDAGVDVDRPFTWDWLAAWSRRDPLTRAAVLGKLAGRYGLLVCLVLCPCLGAVYLGKSNQSFSLWGLVVGALCAAPGALAFMVYGALQGLIGVRPTKLTNGGLLTVFLAVSLGMVTAVFVRGHPVGWALGGVAGLLLGGKLFGFHVRSENYR